MGLVDLLWLGATLLISVCVLDPKKFLRSIRNRADLLSYESKTTGWVEKIGQVLTKSYLVFYFVIGQSCIVSESCARTRTLSQLHVHACRPKLASTEVARAN